ncbi:MAG TPA: ATP-binding protein [Bacteroidota bacterium]|nr:ATP-binding protein [Bacteroidota bacterium]
MLFLTMQKSPSRKKSAPPKKRTRRPAAIEPAGGSDSVLARLHRNILFSGVSPQIVSRVVTRVQERQFHAGEVIFDESSRGRELYCITRGRVRIQKYTKFGVESLLAVLHEGDFFGELSTIDGLPRSARGEAMDDCAVVLLSQNEIRALTKESTEFTFNLLTNLAIRLRTMDQTFVLELDRNAAASKTQVDRLNMLIEASKIVNSAIEIDKLLGLILDAASRSINADRGTLYLLDEGAGELWSKVAQGNNIVEIRLPVGKGLAGYVAKTGEVVNITDAYKDPRFNPEIDKKSGYKTHNVLCMPMRDKEGKILGVFQFLNKREGPFGPEDEAFIDALSVHASIALENARLAREMVQSERLSAVGRMASTIIHDIKNPMGTLRMYAQVIKKKTGDAESAQLAEEMIRQVDRFVNMTQEILDFSRGISDVHLETVLLDEVLEGAIAFIEKDLNKRNVTLVRDFQYTGECTMDVEKMVRVFYNLAGNAADAMKDGGTLTVRTLQKDGMLVIEFADSGCGIPDEIRSKVFEPFFTYGKRHGTGLGLAIVKKIVDDHHGRLEIESVVNQGTTIRMLIPLS